MINYLYFQHFYNNEPLKVHAQLSMKKVYYLGTSSGDFSTYRICAKALFKRR